MSPESEEDFIKFEEALKEKITSFEVIFPIVFFFSLCVYFKMTVLNVLVTKVVLIYISKKSSYVKSRQ